MIAGWNGLALAALAEAARALPSERYRAAAEETGRFITEGMLQTEDRLAHVWIDGQAQGNGFSEDYAGVIDGLLALYQSTFTEEWFETARRLTDHLMSAFPRPGGGFYDTSSDHESLITRPRSLQDSPTPCGNSITATVLLKMAAFTGEGRYWTLAEQTLAPIGPLLERAPLAFGQWLSAYQVLGSGITEVAVVGRPDDPQTKALLDVYDSGFRPATVLAARPPATGSVISVLAGREPPTGVEAAAWVCEHSTCGAPVTDPEGFRAVLDEQKS